MSIAAPRRRGLPRVVGFLLVAVSAWVLCAVALWVDLPDVIRWLAAGLGSTALVASVAQRTGLPIMSAALPTALLAGLAALTQWPTLLAGMAILTATTAALAAIVLTQPAVTGREICREIGVAVSLAMLGGAVAAAYQPRVDGERAGLLAVVLAFACAAGLMVLLGIELGRRGAVALAGAVLIVGLIAGYAYALDQWATTGWIEQAREAVGSVRDVLGAVPRPLIMLLGVPALVWGVSLRARRPQGWWVTALAAPGVAVAAALLLRSDVSPGEGLLIVAYSALPGLALGWGIVKVDRYLSASDPVRDGFRRPEPARFAPLR